MDSRFTKGAVCGVENCRSKRYEEGEDGFTYCRNGHRQEGELRKEDDEDDGDFMAVRTVTRKKKDEDEISTTSTKTQAFTGRRGLDLYLKCVQLILRHQLWFLVQDKGLPAELEKIVYDLWALRIAQFGDRIASEETVADSQSQSQSRSRIYSSQDTSDSESNVAVRGLAQKLQEREKKLVGVPNLYDCLALCYLGIVTLRLPITPGDFNTWIMDDELEFRRAITCVPITMRRHLSPRHQAALEPNSFIDFERFYRTMTRLQMSYEKDHGILWPPLNVQVLLFRYIKDLALPIELYDATTRLGEFLGLDFALRYDGKKRMGLRCYPEAQLVGCLIVCVKLLYPFSTKKAHPHSSSEPAAVRMNWKVWCRQMHALKSIESGETKHLTKRELIEVNEEDVFFMPGKQLDQYLDFYADAFLDEEKIQKTMDNSRFLHDLYNMFPSESTEQQPRSIGPDTISHEQRLEKIDEVQSSMEVIQPVSQGIESRKAARGKAKSGILRPGQHYQIWRKEEELPEQAKIFYEAAAQIAGLSLDMLIMMVFFTESRIEVWRRPQQRQYREEIRRQKANTASQSGEDNNSESST